MDEPKIWPQQVEAAYKTEMIQKAVTARSARNHNNRGGGVRMPSDSLSRKERASLHGECVTYNIGKPMTWEEYNALPEDIQAMYRKRHGQVPERRENNG